MDSSHLKRGSIAHSLSFSSFHRLDLTKILVKDVKLDTRYFRAKKKGIPSMCYGIPSTLAKAKGNVKCPLFPYTFSIVL